VFDSVYGAGDPFAESPPALGSASSAAMPGVLSVMVARMVICFWSAR
jgi:hypothetical protein